MTRHRWRTAGAGTAGALAAAALFPSVAGAHGLVGRADLPIPTWLFGWAAAIVLAASFAALSSLWREPRLQEPGERRLVRVPAIVDVVFGIFGIAFYALVVYAGLKGTTLPTGNFADTAIYVILWVGVAVASVLFGDFFRLVNPWRSLAAGLRWVARGRGWSTRAYPEKLGRWPAAVGILMFAWLELVYVNKTIPSTLAALAIAYAVVQLAGMAVFGIEAWSTRADPFGVYFNMFSQLSVWERRDGVLYLRPPLAGAPRWTPIPGSVALLCIAIGSTSFDGFSNGPAWASITPHLQSFFSGLGAGPQAALELAGTVGLACGVGLVTGVFRLGVRGMHSVSTEYTTGQLLRNFVHSLIPISFAYALAHYFSLLVYQGQAIVYLASDPLGRGSDIFGTASRGIDYNVISGSGIWYVQVGALVCGHVAGLVLAHDRALAMYSDSRQAARSQYWMLVVMVGFTSLGLWLLSSVSR